MSKSFVEAEHPRGRDGRFSAKPARDEPLTLDEPLTRGNVRLDWVIARTVEEVRTGYDGWDHERGANADMSAFVSDHPVTADDLRWTFGPQADHVVDFLERFWSSHGVSDDAYRELRDGWSRDGAGLRTDALTRAARAAREASGLASEERLRSGASAVRELVRGQWVDDRVTLVAQDAVNALVHRHLVGDDFTWDDYDVLSGRWRRIVGPIHPEDAPVVLDTDIGRKLAKWGRREPRRPVPAHLVR